jgi:hypothetical protein
VRDNHTRYHDGVTRMNIDKTEGDCPDRCGPIVIEEADWKPGNPTGHYCQRCGHVFGYEGGTGFRH